MRRRLLWMTVTALAVVGLVFSTGGFEVASMDRDVTVIVSEHDRALVTIWDPGVGSQGQPPHAIASAGLAGEDPVTADGESIRVVAVQNRFTDRSIRVTATATGTPAGVQVGTFEPVTLAPGEAAALEAPVECGEHTGPVDVTLSIRASSGQFEGVVSYDATIVCATPAPPAEPTTTP
jgi:hypothetical protein